MIFLSFKEKLKDTLEKIKKDKYMLAFLVILIFALILRLYYFKITQNQAVWWDESEYLNLAKKWAFGLNYEVGTVRPILMSTLFALLYKFGAGEVTLRLVILVFSIGGVMLMYFIGKELFDKKVALLSTIVMSVFYLHLFYSNRLLVDLPAVTLFQATIYFFWRGYVKQKIPKYMFLTSIFLMLGIMFKFLNLFLAVIIFIFLVVKEKISFLKNKHIWYSLLIGLLVISPYLIYSYITYGNPIHSFLVSGISATQSQATTSTMTLKEGFNQLIVYLKFLSISLKLSFFIAFLFGLIYLAKLILGFDLLIKKKENGPYKQLFMTAWITFPIVYASFFINHFEDRYIFYIYPAAFYVVSLGFMRIYGYLKKINKNLAILIIVVMIFLGSYQQLALADSLIKNKSTSFSLIKPAGQWIKENSNNNDIIISNSVQSELTYYADRKIYGFSHTPEETAKRIKEIKPKYLVITIYFPQSPQWHYTFPQDHSDLVKPISGFFLDKEGKIPGVIIYEVINL